MSRLDSYTPSLDISHDGTNLLILIKRARWKCFPNTCEIRCRINRSGSFVLVAHQTICLKETDSIRKNNSVCDAGNTKYEHYGQMAPGEKKTFEIQILNVILNVHMCILNVPVLGLNVLVSSLNVRLNVQMSILNVQMSF